MLKYTLFSIVALLIFGGCASKPEPKPVVVEVEKPKPVYVAPKRVKRGKVPPLPKREEDIDVDAAVDSAMQNL
ncbi:hypothetical protein MNB_SV-6-1056 [hydrothermal vent metagenome]|uniref:Uncharacterized protein n=1 Tax=hydrothermal vent metagenome TaxID=652676 RepID=A0A1W1BC54_9ZZZZ